MRLDRDANILEHIVSYCEQIELTVERFGDSYDTFQADAIYRNAAALCILQIGELVGKLTEDFRNSHDAIPWRKSKPCAISSRTAMALLTLKSLGRSSRMVFQN